IKGIVASLCIVGVASSAPARPDTCQGFASRVGGEIVFGGCSGACDNGKHCHAFTNFHGGAYTSIQCKCGLKDPNTVCLGSMSDQTGQWVIDCTSNGCPDDACQTPLFEGTDSEWLCSCAQ